MGVVALLNKKGLSLVEVMIALVIVLLVFLALMQTALVSIESNTVNNLRDEAVSIAEMRMNELRNRPFDDLDLNGALDPNPLTFPDETINRNIKNISNFPFTTDTRIDALNSDNKQINIIVTWEWKDKTIANSDPYTHSITTIRRRT